MKCVEFAFMTGQKYISSSQNVLRYDLKSPKFLPFDANLTQFWSLHDIPADESCLFSITANHRF